MQGSDIEWYLYPRICPILSLSSEDLAYCIEVYGRTLTLNTIAKIVATHYDFPYAHSGLAPKVLEPPRLEGKHVPAPPTMLLGGYRCTRLNPEVRIPGITLLMRDSISRLDWNLDGIMEPHRMKCWVAVQGKSRKTAVSPYSRATDIEHLARVLDMRKSELLDHSTLRDGLIGNNEAIPPTVELYLQTINRLNPPSIYAHCVGFGVSLAAMACVANRELPCHYSLRDMTSEASQSLRHFASVAGDKLHETDDIIAADLTFLEVFPYGTHEFSSYRSSQPHNYGEYIRRLIIDPLRDIVNADNKQHPPRRIALVISLRELPSLPTIEPMLMSILCEKNIELVGALVSQKRDYAVFLMLIRESKGSNTEEWKKLLESTYPELSSLSSQVDEEEAVIRPKKTTSASPPHVAAEPWDVVCLNAVKAELITQEPDTSGIVLQGPRKLKGKAVFPTRTRNCPIISETNNLENGDIVYVFSSAHTCSEPNKTAETAVESGATTVDDPHLLRMLQGIKKNILQTTPQAP